MEWYLFLSAVFLRIAPNLTTKNISSPDREFHLYYIKFLKKFNRVMPEFENRIIAGSNRTDYPYLYHQILSFFSDKIIRFVDKFGSLLFDLLAAFFIFYILNTLTIVSGIKNYMLINVLFLLSPIFHITIYSPRSFCLTPRNFSQFINSIVLFLASFLYSVGVFEVAALLFLMVVLASINLMASMFYLQVVFLTMLLSIFFDFKITLFCFMVLFVVTTLFYSRAKKQFWAHIEHLVWYVKCNRGFLKSKNNFANLISALGDRDLRNLVRELLINNTYTSFLLLNWVQVVFLIIFFQNYQNLSTPSFIILCGNLSIIAFVLWLITSVGVFKILGESERYLQYAYPASMIYVLYFNYNYIGVFIIHAIVAYFVNLILIKVSQSKSPYGDLFNVVSQLKLLPKDNLICLDQRDRYSVLLHTDHDVIGAYVNFKFFNGGREFYEYFFSYYPFVNASRFGEICNTHRVSYVIYNKQTLKSIIQQEDSDYKMSDFKIIIENDSYVVYKKKA